MPEKTGLEDFLKSFNVEIGPGLVVDPEVELQPSRQIVFAPIVGAIRHPIVDSLANRAVLTALTRCRSAIRDAGATDPPVNPGVLATPILRTSHESWVETDPDAAEGRAGRGRGTRAADRRRRGRRPPQAGSPDRRKAPRLVLLSSRYVADNQSLELEPTNLDLLDERRELAPGPARTARDRPQDARRPDPDGRPLDADSGWSWSPP